MGECKFIKTQTEILLVDLNAVGGEAGGFRACEMRGPHLDPLLMVVFKAAVEVRRQLGGVDDLRQAL